ncbi:MAG TPA: hypothetical protein VML55_07575, partial [Planctomycetaceae bacterium]|nr:hypothetical protein [Planctomycetaceae bacterium]
RTITDRHRSQLLNYLLLADLSRGKLVNLRPALVEHEFVNTTLKWTDRTAFEFCDDAWNATVAGHEVLHDLFVAMLRDWGTGLDLTLYEEAVTHFLGGAERVLREVAVSFEGQPVGMQKFRLAGPETAFKITAIRPDDQPWFEEHTRRLLSHVALGAIQWINVSLGLVTFRTIRAA